MSVSGFGFVRARRGICQARRSSNAGPTATRRAPFPPRPLGPARSPSAVTEGHHAIQHCVHTASTQTPPRAAPLSGNAVAAWPGTLPARHANFCSLPWVGLSNRVRHRPAGSVRVWAAECDSPTDSAIGRSTRIGLRGSVAHGGAPRGRRRRHRRCRPRTRYWTDSAPVPADVSPAGSHLQTWCCACPTAGFAGRSGMGDANARNSTCLSTSRAAGCWSSIR